VTPRARIVHIAFNHLMKLPALPAELQSLREEYDLVVILPRYDDDEASSGSVPGIQTQYITIRSRQWSDSGKALLKLLRFVEFTFKAFIRALRSRARLYVAHDMPAMLPLFPFLLFSPRRVVYNAHELWSEAAEDNAPLRPIWRILERIAMRRSGRVIVPEPNRARIVHTEYRARQAPAVVRNIPAAPPPFQRGTLLHSKLSLSDDAVIVLYQGLLAATRCLVELAQSLAFLPGTVHIVLAGAGDAAYEQQLHNEAARFRGRIHLLPWTPREQLQHITNSADIGVLLYRNDGRNNFYAAPNKLYEYLFAGLPVVASAFPGLMEIVDAGGYGSCADPSSPEHIARAISAALAIKGGEDIAQRARMEFTWDAQVQVLHEVYRNMMENAREC